MKKNIFKLLFAFTLLLLVCVCALFIISKSKIKECDCKVESNNQESVNKSCLSTELGAMIADVENQIHYVDVREITSKKVTSWEIAKNDKVGVYAIIQSDEESAINDIKKYFEGIDKNYKYKNITNNYYVFISNGQDIDLDDLNKCIK